MEKLTKISEECSAIESDATKSELSSEDEADYIQNETSDTGLLGFYTFVKPTMQKKLKQWFMISKVGVQIFFNILDLTAINAWILYKETTGIQIQRK